MNYKISHHHQQCCDMLLKPYTRELLYENIKFSHTEMNYCFKHETTHVCKKQ